MRAMANVNVFTIPLVGADAGERCWPVCAPTKTGGANEHDIECVFYYFHAAAIAQCRS